METPVLDILDAQTTFAQLVEEASVGEEVIIAKAGRPLARLTSITGPAGHKRLGFLKGIADAFNAPLDGETADSFEA
jgi:prevent-host-death family protein